MITIAIALLGSVFSHDFANDYSRSPLDAHIRQHERDIARLDRMINDLEKSLYGLEMEERFHTRQQQRSTGPRGGACCGGGPNRDGHR